MRTIAAIYLIIVLLNFGFWVTNTSPSDLLFTPYVCLLWGLYLCSVLALFAYAIGRRIVHRKVWQLVFGIYLATRLFELASVGIAVNGVDLVADLNRVASYMWLVLPAGLAMWHLGFARSAKRRGDKQPSTETLTAHERVLNSVASAKYR